MGVKVKEWNYFITNYILDHMHKICWGRSITPLLPQSCDRIQCHIFPHHHKNRRENIQATEGLMAVVPPPFTREFGPPKKTPGSLHPVRHVHGRGLPCLSGIFTSSGKTHVEAGPCPSKVMRGGPPPSLSPRSLNLFYFLRTSSFGGGGVSRRQWSNLPW